MPAKLGGDFAAGSVVLTDACPKPLIIYSLLNARFLACLASSICELVSKTIYVICWRRSNISLYINVLKHIIEAGCHYRRVLVESMSLLQSVARSTLACLQIGKVAARGVVWLAMPAMSLQRGRYMW
jgi:hypothetical protein